MQEEEPISSAPVDAVTLVSSNIFTDVDSAGVGKGGNIDIRTGTLSLTNGATLYATTSGQGDGGSVSLQTGGSVTLKGNGTSIFSTVDSEAAGKGGDIDIQAASLSLSDGTFLANSNAGGRGDSGNIKIDTGSLSLTNLAFLNTATSGQGSAGNISVQATDSVSLANRSSFSSYVNTNAVGKGGDITIRTGSRSLTDRASLLATTFGHGNAGSVTIEARDTVAFDKVSGIASSVSPGAVGNGGDVNIQARSLSLSNSAQLNVGSFGEGSSGDIQVAVRSMSLDEGSIAATSTSANGGNIRLQAQDLLLLRHGSLISTTAGYAGAGGNGGNITISTPFIVAFPKENSDISANAYTGSGGNIQIAAQGILGIQFQPQDTPLSDITASSRFGAQGVIKINTWH